VAEPRAERIADGVYRCGTRFVNWYVVDDGGRLTVVDAGLPGYWSQFDGVLDAIGRSRDDVAAVVLTHGHSDHVGFSERLRGELDLPVWIHGADEEMAGKGKRQKPEGSPLPNLRYPFAYRFLVHFLRAGGAKIPPVEKLSLYEDGQRIDAPGQPLAIHTPGHTEGMCALHFESHRVLVAGDALCTLNPMTGGTGPQLLPRAFNVDTARARDSLDRLESVQAPLLVFGHGDPWTAKIETAVALARAAKVS
jgi:glyoxylase-like metal-dependent hydrolase (beta-lactamase superfamily II)